MDRPLRESGRYVADLVGPLAGSGPLYRQVADALKAAIDRGELAAGTVLPPERTLAAALAVGRSTVVAAYDRLKAEGWLESRQGSGTWVRQPDDPTPHGVDAVATARLLLDPGPTPGENDQPDGEREADLSVAAVTATPTVASVLASLDERDLAPLLDHHGYLPQGLPELRDAVAARLTAAGLGTSPESLVVTTGAHQAISLVVRQTIEPGDVVVIESPTFPGVLDIVRRFGAKVVPLPVDAHGARTDLLDELTERHRPKLIFVTPHFHSPTGTVMPTERRRQLADLADRTGTTIIEDLVLADLALDHDPDLPHPVASFTQSGTVHTIGSASKLFWAGLRVGWIRSPDSWHQRMLSTKTVADLGSPLIDQLLTTRLLAHTDRITTERRHELRTRRDLLCQLLSDQLPDWTWHTPAGGLSLWVQLPAGNADEFTDHAARHHHVRIIPGPALSVDDGNRRAIRLTYARPEATIHHAVEQLTHAWHHYTPTVTPASARLIV